MILAADSAIDLAAAPQLAEHIQSCAECRGVATKLQKLERAVAHMPAAEGADAARHAFLARLGGAQSVQVAAAPRPLRFRNKPVIRLALAASILLAIGLLFILTDFSPVQKAEANETVVDRLVDWNLQLADAESDQQRQVIFADLGPLKSDLDRSHLAAPDRQLAQKLIDSGTSSMSHDNDEIDQAQRLGELADAVLERMDGASESRDVEALGSLGRNFAILSNVSVPAKLARAKASAGADLDRLHRIANAFHLDENRSQKLEKLLDKSPDISRNAIRRALKWPAPAKHHK